MKSLAVRIWSLTVSLCTVAVPHAAFAHGAAAVAVEIVADPADAQHIVVRTTYGMVQTLDGGKAWRWACEDVLGAGATDHKLAISDRLVVATSLGIALSADRGCAWHAAKTSAVAVDAMALAVDPQAPLHVLALVHDATAQVRQLLASVDGGETWLAKGQPLPPGLNATALLVAPSNAQRIYVSGWGSATAAVLRSDDGGASWVPLPLPVTAAEQVLAVDPLNPDRVYVRQGVLNDDLLLVSSDAGLTWAQKFKVTGGIVASALSPDGKQLLLSTLGANDVGSGLWGANTEQFAFQALGPYRPGCLTWTGAGLYACGFEATDGYTVGVSHDGGKTFAALHHRTDLFPLACAAGTATANLCPDEWPEVAITLGIDDPWASAPGSAGDAGASTPDAAAATPTQADASGVKPVLGPRDDLGCQAGRSGGRAWWPLALLALAAVVARRGRRDRARG